MKSSAIRIGLIGDYNAEVPAHRAIPMALSHAAEQLQREVRFEWLATDTITSVARVADFDGLWCAPASPYRSMEGALLAIQHARVTPLPFLGTCGGFQHAVIEYARNRLGWTDAEHAETAPDALRRVIAPLECALLGATGSLRLFTGTRIAAAYGRPEVIEGYRCRYGLNPRFQAALLAGPLHAAAADTTGDLRAVELDDHPFFVATLFQPELAALQGHPAPLVAAFLRACGSWSRPWSRFPHTTAGGRMARTVLLGSILAAAMTLMIVAPAQAHHSRAAFQLDQKSTLKAKITKVRWSNPHMFLVGNVVNDGGQTEEWIFEGHSISGLTRAGWMKDSVKAGDEIQLIVNLHRDRSKHFGLIDHVIMADGRQFWSIGMPPRDANAAPPVIAPSTDFSGNWRYRFPGTPEQVRQRVLLGAQGPAADGPYTARAAAQVKAYDANANPTLRCLPITMPLLLMTVYEYKWIRHPDRIVIEKEQYLDATRVIHLDGKPRPPGTKPSLLGYSVGRFEPDGTLVVETTGFSASPWGNGNGIDSSEQKHIVERYKLIEGGMGLSLSFTQEDSVYFTKPVTGQGTFAKTPDSNFAKNPPCDLKAARQHLEFER